MGRAYFKSRYILFFIDTSTSEPNIYYFTTWFLLVTFYFKDSRENPGLFRKGHE